MMVLSKIRALVFVVLLAMVTVTMAQQEIVAAAYEFWENNKLDSAKAAIEKAVLNTESDNDPLTWRVRGIIYKEIYKQKEKANKLSPARIESCNSFRKSILLDKTNKYLESNIGAMKDILKTLHNDIVESLDPIGYETAIEVFRKYQEYYKIINTSPEAYQAMEISFDLDLGNVYSNIIQSSKDSARTSKYMELGISLYKKILSMDPNIVSAYYGIAMLHYNQAVNLIKSLDYDTDLALFEIVQNQSSISFKNSLPYMVKAGELDPSIEAISNFVAGIYLGLHARDELYLLMKFPGSRAMVPKEIEEINARIMAIYIYNFAKYIEWPDKYKDGNFVIGFIGDDRALLNELSKMALSKKIGNQSIEIRNISSIDDTKFNIIFIPYDYSSQFSEVISKTKDKSTLIVTEKPGLAKQGAAMNFIVIDNKQKFELNKTNLEKYKLKVANALEKMAQVVN